MIKIKSLILTALAAATIQAAAVRPAVIPEPVSYTATGDWFSTPAQYTVTGDKKLAGKAVDYLKRDGLQARRSSRNANLTVTADPQMADGQYTLTVTDGGVSVTAAGAPGVQYALETLRQLTGADGRVETCTVSDSPRFGYRGLMLDVVRCYIPAAEVKRIIDVAARLKLNNLHLHLTDDNGWRLQIKKYPLLTEVGAWRVARPELFPGRLNARSADEPTTEGGFYTQDEMRSIVRYAADRNINVIPEIEMPAHAAAAIASYPDLACPTVDKFVGVFPGIGGKDASIIMCAGREETFEFIRNVLDEVMEIFPSPTIHLGGDEANKSVWRTCPLCNERIAHEHLDGYEGLQAYLMDRVNHYVRSKGRTAMGWDEVTYGDPKEDMIIYGWQGDGGVAVRDSRRSGRRFILTPAKTMYLIRYQGPQWFEPWTYFGNNTLRDIYMYEPVGEDWDAGLRSNLLGVQGSMWCEFCKSATDVQYQILPRLLAVADVAWRPEGRRDWQGFLTAVDSFVPWLESNGITYARSMYNLDHKVKGDVHNGKRTLDVAVSCIRPDMEVRYAIGDSTRMTVPFDSLHLTEPATVYAATFGKDGQQMGRTLALKLDWNKATACPVTGNCRNGLAYALTNGLRGSDRNSDFEWAGWYNEPAEMVVDLGQVTPVNNITLGTLVHSDICVAAPSAVYVYTSQDGNAYTLQRTISVDPALVYHKQAKVVNLTCNNLGANARYVKLLAVNPGCVPDGYAREGTPTWMYFDELSVD